MISMRSLYCHHILLSTPSLWKLTFTQFQEWSATATAPFTLPLCSYNHCKNRAKGITIAVFVKRKRDFSLVLRSLIVVKKIIFIDWRLFSEGIYKRN
jgi:hypothetical protein